MIIYFAGTPYDGVAGTDRQLAERLGDMHPVLYVDPPVSLLTPLLRPHLASAFRGSSLRREADGVWRIRPRVLPAMYRPGMHHVTAMLVRRAARRTARRLARRVGGAAGGGVAGVVVATHSDLLDAVKDTRTVLYVTDDLVAGSELIGLPRQRVAAARDSMAARAGAIAVCSPLLRDQFRERGFATTLVPNGCAPEAYAAIEDEPWPRDVPRFDRPAVGFAGHINARIDLGLLEAIADAGHPLVLIGPHDPGHHPVRFRALIGRPNVYWAGRRSFAELPAYLRTIRVGLTPYLLDDFNRASFPIKTLDYLAAGRAVVSTDLPATRWLRDFPDGRELIRSESTPRGFLRAVEEELAAEPTPELVARRRAYAAGHDWGCRARQLARLVHCDPVSPALEEPAP
ncbi:MULTISPECIES: glycosyltransferase [Actinomadura]|uniref:Glycosyltransferase n=1 Tax=Actinomadura litoris TaxID=2678616 RepID=A0A7K1KZ08_9ACTN|nr:MULTISPECIES: glycosyltransferase [Actinomadura]MBT2209017.1 glycosyltransferase [Actinomadura sp. NEAU-AAG7]MUN37166.1 glycosyltransferase [Actinomadura litoris]